MIDNIRDFLQVYVENWSNWGPQIYAAVGVTIQLTVASFSMAIVLGLLLALGKMSRFPLLRAFCVAYVEVARGIPVLASFSCYILALCRLELSLMLLLQA